jgi:hypothetical protein
MMSIDHIHFDVCKFIYADGIREIVIQSDGEEFKITGTEVTQLADLDFWIVPSGPIESLFREHYKDDKGRESELADEIASGAYVPSR